MYEITIDDRKYTVEDLNPIEGFEYGLQVASIVTPTLAGALELTKDIGSVEVFTKALGRALGDPKTSKILKKALEQCYTPKNERLNNEYVSNQWFKEHKGDMFEVSARACYLLVKDFLPERLLNMSQKFAEKFPGLNISSQ